MADSEELEIEMPEEDAELPIEVPASKRKIILQCGPDLQAAPSKAASEHT
jgi:hypothetical protein